MQIYAEPRKVSQISDCHFYHTMEIPGHGLVDGDWDLRDGVQSYLGNVNFQGRRVLDVGAASGFLSFTMERLGAEVVSYDLSENHPWDIVPYEAADYQEYLAQRKVQIRMLNNAYWFCHNSFKSKAKMVYGTVYDIPDAIGFVDISVLGSILLHVRDPFLALQNVLRLTREMVIVTDVLPRRRFYLRWLDHFFEPRMTFLPDFRKCEPVETWWRLDARLIRRFIGILGFKQQNVTYHWQQYRKKSLPLYTVVGHRTKAA